MTFPEFFKWAEAHGMNDREIARRLGYDNSTVWRVRVGRIKDTTDFAVRSILCFGDPVKPFFSDVVSVATNGDVCIEIGTSGTKPRNEH